MQDFVVAPILLLYTRHVMRLALQGMHVHGAGSVPQMREPVQHRHCLAIRQGQCRHQSEGEALQCEQHYESYPKRGSSQRFREVCIATG